MYPRVKYRSLAAKEVINLTGETLWVYGTSGLIIELKPKEYSAQMMVIPGAYYVVSENLKERAMKDGKIEKEHLLRAIKVGMGRDGDPMSKLFIITDNKTRVMPVTDDIVIATNHVSFAMRPRPVS